MLAVGKGGALPNGVASPPPRVDFSRMHRSSVSEFETRESAIEAGWTAGKERIDTLYAPTY
jgi:hypothetical protein